jgi:glycogen synthase
LAGFGDYSMNHIEDHASYGVHVVRRRYNSFDDSANQMAMTMLNFVKQTRRDRISQRNKVESIAMQYDWANKMRSYYDTAHLLAMQRI